jgi:hypothetical protein
LKPSQLVSQVDGNESFDGRFNDLVDIQGIDSVSDIRALPPGVAKALLLLRSMELRVRHTH